MKNVSLLLAALFLLVSSKIYSQSDSQLYTVRTITVEPAKAMTFEKCLKKANETFKEADVNGIVYYTSSNTNYEYYVAVPIDNMAELDKRFWTEAISKMGEEKFEDTFDPVTENILETEVEIYRNRLDWDYEHPSLKDQKLTYRKWTTYQFKQGTKEQVEELMKEWLTLFKEKDIVRRQSFYVGLIGPKYGTMVSVLSAKDRTTFSKNEAEFWDKVGEEGEALWDKTKELVVKIESKEGRFREELSLMPSPVEETITAENK